MAKIFGMDERELEAGLARLGPEWNGIDLNPKRKRRVKKVNARRKQQNMITRRTSSLEVTHKA